MLMGRELDEDDLFRPIGEAPEEDAEEGWAP